MKIARRAELVGGLFCPEKLNEMDYEVPLTALLITPFLIYSFRWVVFGSSDRQDAAPSTRMPRRYSAGELLDKDGKKIMDL